MSSRARAFLPPRLARYMAVSAPCSSRSAVSPGAAIAPPMLAVTVTVVPGITSAFAAPAVAGTPVSHRGVAHEIVVVSGHVAPGDPRSLTDWAALGRMSGTIVLMMAVERLGRFADVLITHGRPPETPVLIVQDGTTRIQRTVRATLETAEEAADRAEISPPAIIVIGPVAGLEAPVGGPDVASDSSG